MSAETLRERVALALAEHQACGLCASQDGPCDECLGEADAALAVVAADTEGIARVLAEHTARPAGSPHCACGWRPAMYLNDTESDRGQHRHHQAGAVVAHLAGEPR